MMGKNGSSGPDWSNQNDGAIYPDWDAWSQVPSSAATDTRLSMGARCLFVLLCGYRNQAANNAYPSQARMARDLGRDIRSVKRWLAELQAAGWLTIHRRGKVQKDWNGHPMARLYEFHGRPKKGKIRAAKGHRSHLESDTIVTLKVTQESPELDYKNKTIRTKEDTAAALSKYGDAQVQAALNYALSKGADHAPEYALKVLSEGRRFKVRADPSEYRQDACPECFQVNGHAADCSQA